MIRLFLLHIVVFEPQSINPLFLKLNFYAPSILNTYKTNKAHSIIDISECMAIVIIVTVMSSSINHTCLILIFIIRTNSRSKEMKIIVLKRHTIKANILNGVQ